MNTFTKKKKFFIRISVLSTFIALSSFQVNASWNLNKLENNSSLSAQNQTVKGKITDTNGEGLTGVSILLKGTTNGTSTDINGNYSLNIPEDSGVLIVSYLGFISKEVPVNNRATINIQLEEDSKALSEVVVVGYGTQSKASITGAVSTINAEEIIRTPAVAATSALVSKVPGITARATDSRPGNGTNLQIRNLGNPLYVIDGVPYSTNDGTTAFGLNTGVSGQNIFNNLGLEDIESITVLKDASASIYGLRASNGVVLVTTKKGKKNETPTINVSSYYGLQNFTRFPGVANAGQYVRGLVESAQNFGATPAYTAAELASRNRKRL